MLSHAKLLAVVLLAVAASSVQAERPTAPKMLPDTTVAYLRVHKTPELVTKWKETSFGRLLNDEKVKPLIGSLYGSAAEAFAEAADELGLDLDQLFGLPQGELCIALVKDPNDEFAVVVIAEVKDHMKDAKKLLDLGLNQVKRRGGSIVDETIGDTKVQVVKERGNNERVAIFDREGVLVISSKLEIAKNLIAKWDGGEGKTLADNRKFLTIMRQSAGTRQEPPQISWYADPLDILKTATKDNFSAQIGLAVLPQLGVDGFKALGGSVVLAPKDFDTIMHFHFLLDHPRKGLMKTLTFDEGDFNPEPWVPEDAANYTTLFWNATESYNVIEEVYNDLRGDGAFERDIIESNVSERLGVDFKSKVIDALAGRFTMTTRVESTEQFNGQATVVGIKLKDGRAFEKTLEKILDSFSGAFKPEVKKYRSVTYYVGPKARAPGRGRGGNLIRAQQPAFGIVGDYLIISDSPESLRRVIATKQSNKKSLGDALDYRLVAGKISRQIGNRKPCLVAFERPEEALGMLYNVARSSDVQGFIRQAGENNRGAKILGDALAKHPLPPFEELKKYLAPAGAVMTSDESGIHYVAFGLKVE